MGFLFKEKHINIQIVVYDILTYSMKNQQLANNILIFHYKEKMKRKNELTPCNSNNQLIWVVSLQACKCTHNESFMSTIFS